MLELADAVVVGGGVHGLSVTHALARRLSRVLLLEADRCGNKATAGGFAWVNASSKWQDEPYHQLNAEACRKHVAMASEYGPEQTGWHGGGTLCWRPAPDGSAADQPGALQSSGFPVAHLDEAELRALEPTVAFGAGRTGVFYPSEGWAETARMVRHLTALCRERGAEIAAFTRAVGFTMDYRGAIASVETTSGRVSTRLLIICAGTETGPLIRLLGGPVERMAGAITRSEGLLLETGPLPEEAQLRRVCLPDVPGGFHIRPTLEGGLLMGADDTDEMCADQKGATGEEGGDSPEALLLRRASAVIPALRGVTFTSRRCWRPMPQDGLPVVGPLPGATGVYLLVSHSGVTLAPLLGPLLSDEIITGRLAPILSRYRPTRFLSNAPSP